MFGFLFGTACLAGLYFVLRGEHHGWHDSSPWRHRMGPLRFLFRRLDTTPGQEKALRAALEDVIAEARTLRDALRETRGEAAQALRPETFDESSLRQSLERHDALLARLRESVVGALSRAHETLDAEQRARLAALLERGHAFAHHPYR